MTERDFMVGDKVRVVPLSDFMHADYDFDTESKLQGERSKIWKITGTAGDRVRLYCREIRERWTTRSRLRHVDAVDLLAEVGRFVPTNKDVGRSVVYTAHEGAKAEDGVITGVSDIFVFVRYRGDVSSKATRPQDLQWLSA